MILETERLTIVPLTPRRLRLWAENLALLEKEMDIIYDATPMEGIFLDVVRGQLEPTEDDSINYQWHTFWLLIRKNDHRVVGSADFKDVPDPQGRVEIGYGLGERYEHNGYMTEAVKEMCRWALQQPSVEEIIAETEPDGFASQRVLVACGFRKHVQGETLWWKKTGKS